MGAYLPTPITLKSNEFGGEEDTCTYYGLSSMQGWRFSMEDAHIATPGLKNNTMSIYGVFDGHGGSSVAKWVSKHLIEEFLKQIEENRKNPKEHPRTLPKEYNGRHIDQDLYLYASAIESTFFHLDELMKSEKSSREIRDLYNQENNPDGKSTTDIDAYEEEYYSSLKNAQYNLRNYVNKEYDISDPNDRNKVKENVTREELDDFLIGFRSGRQDIFNNPSYFGDQHSSAKNEEDSSSPSRNKDANTITNTNPPTSSNDGDTTPKAKYNANGDSMANSCPPTTDGEDTFQADFSTNATADESVATTNSFAKSTETPHKPNGLEPHDTSKTEQSQNMSDTDQSQTLEGDEIKEKSEPNNDDKDKSLSCTANTNETSEFNQYFNVLKGDHSNENQDSKQGAKEHKADDDEEDDEEDDDEDDEYNEEYEYDDDDIDDDESTNPFNVYRLASSYNKVEVQDICGTTAIVIVFIAGPNPAYIIANAGDSRAILSRDGKAITLSLDHKPSSPIEFERIRKAGGCVYSGRVDGNLNLSRSLGDHHYKKEPSLGPQHQKITCLPDVTICGFHKQDDFIVIACDGIWDCKSGQEVVDFIQMRMSDNPTPEEFAKISEELCDDCLSKSPDTNEGVGCDNMTCMIIKPSTSLLANASDDPPAIFYNYFEL